MTQSVILSEVEGSDVTATTTYSHNVFNQLTDVTDTPPQAQAQAGGQATTFDYDALGRRIEKTTGSTTYQYTWDGNQIIEVRDGAGSVLRKHVYGAGIDEPIYLKNGTIRYYYTMDGLGSVSELTNAAGTKLEYYTYDVYGAVTIYNRLGTELSASAYNNTYYFTGREYDSETGLYYYRARYYDAVLGRFLETDPIGYAGGINLYGYVQNNPWNKVDPLGLGDFPGDWDNGVVTNNTDHSITVVDMDNGTTNTLGPGETSDSDVDIDFVNDNGTVTKVGPNNVTVENNGNVKQTGIDLIPGQDPRSADPNETNAVNKIIEEQTSCSI